MKIKTNTNIIRKTVVTIMMISLFCCINAGCGITIEESATFPRTAETEKEGKEIKIRKTQLREISTEKEEEIVKTESIVNETQEIKPTETEWREDTAIQQEQYTTETNMEPVHVHSFDIPIYGIQTIHHDATGHNEPVYEQVWVVDSHTPVMVSVDICQVCGYECPFGGAIDIHIRDAHNWKSTYRTENHETGEYTENGHYENQVVGETWVQDNPEWDENVDVIVGYQCSCGAIE